MVDLSFASEFIPQIDVYGLINMAITVLLYLVVGVIGAAVIWYVWKTQQYNVICEIWTMREGSVIPSIERNIKGGYILEKGMREFQLLPKRFSDAVIRIDPKHIVKDGRKRYTWLRRAGTREYYSFVPRTWINKQGKQDFVLEVEDGSIVNQAIMKDRMIQEKHKEFNKLKEYAPLAVSVMGYIALIIIGYFTYKWATAAIGSVESMRQACHQAITQGGWLIFLIPKILFREGKSEN